jgi:hypothetical protein
MTIRTYWDLRRLQSFEERFAYLALHGQVGEATFGFDRYINQGFYRSTEWKRIRSFVIVRDNGCDLGIEDREIHDAVYIHHMNPMTRDQIRDGDESILNPDYLISVTHKTHNAIHYGDRSLLPAIVVERKPGDTKLW